MGSSCEAEYNNGFEFSSWTQDLGKNSSKTISTAKISDSPFNSLLRTFGFASDDESAILNVNDYGTFTANFRAIPPPIPPEYWIPLYGVIVSSIVGWSIPSIVGWAKSRRDAKRLHRYHKKINSLYNDGKLDENDIESLDILRTDLANAYAKGKISEQHYTNLKSDISVLYEEVYNKRIDSLNGISNKDNDKLLDRIKNDMTDAYAKGKINELHYDLLNKKISDYENSHSINSS